MSMSTIAQAVNVMAWAVEETVFGTVVKPTKAAKIIPLGTPTVTNEREVLENEEKDGFVSDTEVLMGRYNPTEWSMQLKIKPSGSAGTAPQGSLLYECAMGTKTGGGTVVYTLANSLKSFTLWVLFDHTMIVVPGCTVNSMALSVPGNQFGKATFSGNGLQRLWCGTDTTQAGGSGSSIVVSEAKRFIANTYVNVGADNNSGAGFKINTVTVGTNTLTLASAPSSVVAGLAVTPWVPTTGTAPTGYSIYGKLGYASRNGGSSDLPILEGTVTLDNGLEYPNEEKNNSLYPSEFFRPGKRKVSVELKAYYHQRYADFFYYQENATLTRLVLPLGNEAGKICTIYVPASGVTSADGGILMKNPNPSGDTTMEISVSGESKASLTDSATGNNELSITFS